MSDSTWRMAVTASFKADSNRSEWVCAARNHNVVPNPTNARSRQISELNDLVLGSQSAASVFASAPAPHTPATPSADPHFKH